jgi:hypothetical protein
MTHQRVIAPVTFAHDTLDAVIVVSANGNGAAIR